MKLDELKEELNKDPEFTNKYDELQLKYEIAKLVLKTRKELNMTQEQLAKKTGIDRSDISKLENALTNPSLKLLHRIANALDVQINIEFKKRPKSSQN